MVKLADLSKVPHASKVSELSGGGGEQRLRDLRSLADVVLYGKPWPEWADRKRFPRASQPGPCSSVSVRSARSVPARPRIPLIVRRRRGTSTLYGKPVVLLKLLVAPAAMGNADTFPATAYALLLGQGARLFENAPGSSYWPPLVASVAQVDGGARRAQLPWRR